MEIQIEFFDTRSGAPGSGGKSGREGRSSVTAICFPARVEEITAANISRLVAAALDLETFQAIPR